MWLRYRDFEETRCRCGGTVRPAVLSLLFCPHPALLLPCLDQTSRYTIWVGLTPSLPVRCRRSVSVQGFSLLKLNNSVKWRWAHKPQVSINVLLVYQRGPTLFFIHDAGPGIHYLRRSHSSSESGQAKRRKKRKDSWDSSLVGSSAHGDSDKATRRREGTGPEAHPSC